MRKAILGATVVLVATAATIGAVASAASTQANTEHFAFIDTSTTAPEPVYSVIATGAFTDGGTAMLKSKDVLVLDLSAGTITLHTANKTAHLTKTQTATACMQTGTKDGGYTITQGTGAYRRITGSGHAAIDNVFVEKLVNGSCSSSFAAAQAIVTASGPVTLS